MNETRARELLLLAADTIDVDPAGPLDTTSARRRSWLPALAAAAAVVLALGVTAYVVGRDDDSATPVPSDTPTPTESPSADSAAEQFLAFATGPDTGVTDIFATGVVVAVDGEQVLSSGGPLSRRESWSNMCGFTEDGDCSYSNWLNFVGEQEITLERADNCEAGPSPVAPALDPGGHVEVLWRGCDFAVVLGVQLDGKVASVQLNRDQGEVEVPEVRGLYRNEAVQVLHEAGFVVTIRTVDTEQCYDENHVITQRPEAGTQVAAGSTVTIEVNHETEDPAFCGGDPLAPPR